MHYDIDIHENLVIGHFGEQQLLVDTGAPASFADANIEIVDTVYEVASDYMGHDAAYFSRKLNRRVDGFLGADILCEYDFCIDYVQRRITLSSTPLDIPDDDIPLGSALGFPFVVDLTFAGREYPCYLDTGATVTYLDTEDLEQGRFIRRFQDFNPMLGDFNTDLYACDTAIGKHAFTARIGQLPDSANALLSLMGVRGIVGFDLLRAYRATFQPRRSRLHLAPYPAAHDAWATYYDQVNEVSFGNLIDDLSEMTLEYVDELLAGKGCILDAGSGTGRLSIPLCQRGYAVVAIDASSQMVVQQKEKATTAGCDFPIIHSGIQEYDGRHAFDLVICVHTVMAYLATPDALEGAVAAFYRATKPGGRVLVDIPFRSLFQNHVHQGPGFQREIRFERLENNQYRYTEETAMQSASGFHYEDAFLLRAWTLEEVTQAFGQEGFELEEDLTEHFTGSGHHYLLFTRPTGEQLDSGGE